MGGGGEHRGHYDHAVLGELTLKQGGFDETQAESVAHTLDQAVNENFGTKTDLKLLRAEVKQGFAEINAATEKAIAKSEAATEKAIAKSEAATEKAIARSEAATTNAIAEMRAAIAEMRAESAQKFEEKFTTLYRHLWAVGASIVVIMITLFLVN